jgi:membrane protein implicated in regulation of membrane protease activity
MGTGVFLLVVGAILAFAVKDGIPGISLPVTGLILMIAGAALVVHSRYSGEREKRIIRREDSPGEDGPRVIEEIVKERHKD